MEKVFKPKVSKFLILIVLFFTAVSCLLISTFPKKQNGFILFVGIAFLAIDFLYVVPSIFFTKYTFEEQYLVVREWPFKYTKVFYEDIVGFDDAEKNDEIREASLAFNGISIGYYDDDDNKKYIKVSPKDMQMFLLILGTRANNFKDAEKLRVERIERAKDAKKKRRKKYLENEELKKKQSEEETIIIKVSGLPREHGFRIVEE